MLFHNPAAHTVSFKIGDLAWSIPAKGECDIPPNLAYVVSARGLPLVEGTAGGARVEAQVTAPVPSRLLPGVEVGPAVEPEPLAEVSGAPAVDAAAERLRAAGAVLPSKKGKGR